MFPWIVHSIGSSCFSWIEKWVEYEDRALYHNEIASVSFPWFEERIGHRFQSRPSPSPFLIEFDLLFFEQSMLFRFQRNMDPVGHEQFSAPT